jgi:itaconate CoA-transferase
VWYEPVLSIAETVEDPVVVASGAFLEVPGPEGSIPAVATPVDFVGSRLGPARPTPALGEHTDEVLADLGHDWERVVDWKVRGIVL